MRLSELTGLRCQDVQLQSPAHIKCLGKGRKRRDIPIDKATVAVLRPWPDRTPRRTRRPALRLAPTQPAQRRRRAAPRRQTCRSRCGNLPVPNRQIGLDSQLASQRRHGPPRHGLDAAVVALWLGHEKFESVKPYIHADPALKQRALERLTPLNPDARPGRFQPTDDLLVFLDGL